MLLEGLMEMYRNLRTAMNIRTELDAEISK